MTATELCRLLVKIADSLVRDGLPNFAGAVPQGTRRIAAALGAMVAFDGVMRFEPAESLFMVLSRGIG